MAEFTYIRPNLFHTTEVMHPVPVVSESEWVLERIALTEDTRPDRFNAGTPTPRQIMSAESVLNAFLAAEGLDDTLPSVYLIEVFRVGIVEDWTPYVVLSEKEDAGVVMSALQGDAADDVFGAAVLFTSRPVARKLIRESRTAAANLGLPRG